jgi:hypothetical protein
MRRNRTRRNKSKRRSGGAATVFPLKYFDTTAPTPDASAGHNLLKAEAPLGVRPRIGGRRTKRKTTRRRKTSGGFMPSIMEPFVHAASKYIVPIALYAGYKLMTRKGKKGSKRSASRRK